MFELPITGVLQPIPDSSSPIVQQIQNAYGVTVSFKQRPRVYITTVIVRGSVDNSKAVKEATARLIESLTGNLGVSIKTLINFLSEKPFSLLSIFLRGFPGSDEKNLSS